MRWLLTFASYLKSNKNGVLICLIGTIAQALHTYKIIVYSSQLPEEWMRQMQAIVIGVFFSLGLVMYTFRAGSTKAVGELSLKKKYKKYANMFAFFEILVNIHYWTRYFLIVHINNGETIDLLGWYDWSITMVVSIFLPVMIASYAGHVRIPDIITKTDRGILDSLQNGGVDFRIERNYKKDKDDKQYLKLSMQDK